LFADQTLRDAGHDIWKNGEPNGGTGENCGVINRNTLFADIPCTARYPFFCELNY
jgi:hypothetical protein